MQKCKHCSSIFNDDEIRDINDYENIDVGNGKLTIADLSYSECPYCGSSNYDDAYECIICGKYFNEDELSIDSICDNCLKENATLENLLNFGKQNNNDCEINYFLLFCFKEQIEEILKKELYKINNKQEIIDKFLNEYRDDFSNFIKGKINER